MEETRGEFIKTIKQQYETYCDVKGIEPTLQGFGTYMVNRNLITDTTIKRFIVVDKYPESLRDNMGIKTVAMYDLEDKFNINYSSIRYYIAKFQSAFRLKSRVISKF